MHSLNPVHRVGAQVLEAPELHVKALRRRSVQLVLQDTYTKTLLAAVPQLR